MIVDTSAIVALIQDEEHHAARVAAALAGVRRPVMSAPTVAECLIVLTARQGPVARAIFERLRSEIDLSVADFTDRHAAAAQRAFLRYGKGRHPDLEFSGIIGYWPTPA
jgi:ribonuclease VapC